MRDLLLVGSIPLENANKVFEATRILSPYLAQMPDGETGARAAWTQWQGTYIGETLGLEIESVKTIQGGLKYTQYRVMKDRKPGDVHFRSLGYAQAALQSYKEFCAWRDRGAFRPGTRFQVSLPTPFAVVFAFFGPASTNDIWPIYERRLFEELAEICEKIPHDDLAIQWDIASEIHRVLEVPGMSDQFPVMEGIVRAADRVPDGVQVGIHLCYGDPGHKHIIEPRDMGLMVDMSNQLAREVKRSIDWLHVPVPRDRDDDAYFEPLRRLELRDETKLFVGLIHLTDGIDGAKRRIATASKFWADFGLATECGFGRRSSETILGLIDLHADAAKLN